MRRLIWGFAGRKCLIVGNLMSRLKYNNFVCAIEVSFSISIILVITYLAEIAQCFPARSNPVSATESPINIMVGATVKGPINLKRMPTMPLAPIRISTREATMRLPTSWKSIKYLITKMQKECMSYKKVNKWLQYAWSSEEGVILELKRRNKINLSLANSTQLKISLFSQSH